LDKEKEGKEERALTEALLMQCISKTPTGGQHVVHCYGVNIVQEKRSKEVQLVLELAPYGALHSILHTRTAPCYDHGTLWYQ
jgi:hypothetical protein